MNWYIRVCLCIVAGLVLFPSYLAVTNDSKTGPDKEVLLMEISVTGKPTLTVPVISERKSAFLPVTGTGASAVKVVRWVENDVINFEVLAVLDALPKEATCEKLKGLRTQLVASYSGRKGETIRVSALEHFDVPPFDVKIVGKPAASVDCLPGCCCCGTTLCCPRKSACLQCGDCGLCCN